MIKTHILGFPRMGVHRELKTALERHWRGELPADALEAQAAELRRVAQLGLSEVVHRAVELNRGRDDIDALLHAFEPHRLRAEDAAVGDREHELKMNLAGAGIVTGVVTRVKVDFLEARDASAPQSLFAGASRCHG